MSYREYPTPDGGYSRRHDNGHVLRPAQPDYAAIIQADQKRQQANVQTLVDSLVETMGEDEYYEWIESVPGEYTYRTLIPVLQAKLAEYDLPEVVVVGELDHSSSISVAQTNPNREIGA